MRVISLVFLVIATVAVLACTDSGPGSLSTPTSESTNTETPDIAATVEAGIVATQEVDSSIRATIEAQVAQTLAAPTSTPIPQPAQRPTLAPTAIPTPTTVPTATSTKTLAPTPTAILTTAVPKLIGDWYRNADWEHSLTEVMKEIHPNTAYDIRVVTLDATPDSVDQDLAFSLGCIGSTQVAYLSPYSGETLEYVDTLVFGIWDDVDSEYLVDHEHFYSNPVLTDDGSSIYINNNAQLRQIITTLTRATEGMEPSQSLISGMWEQDKDDDFGLWSEFDSAGIGDALRYLGCFPDVEGTHGKHRTVPADLREYAAYHAGGPGAIYVGDLSQLVGPAPTREQGDFDGNVPLESLENHLWIYESPFYEELLEKAKLTDPTPMTYDGDTITIQHACINRALLPCVLLETYFAPNLLERTNGKLEFITSSFPELGLAGLDTLSLITDGTLDSATIYGGYVGGEVPPIEIQNLWGIYSSREQEFEATQAIIRDIEELVLAETGGVIMNHSWYAGNDQFFFCRERIDSLDGFAGKKSRSHSAALSDWINGMGAEAQFLAFAEVYTAIERGILDCGVTGADAGFGQRWYEVADYLMGPLFSFPSVNNVINDAKWASLPDDLQQIIVEEAAKSELEALRLATIQNDMGLIKLTTERGAGRDKMEFVPFSYEVKYRSLNTAVPEHVVPAWVSRVGYTRHPIITDSFNNKIGPVVGLRIETDGLVVKVPITQGPYDGKTMEQVLAE